MKQVILNLLTNARDALNARYPECGENKIVRIMGETVENDEGRWVRLVVEDRGVGVPIEVQDRIFDPFFTTKSRAEKTGLGLSVSHGIVKEHGGKLWVESQIGEGARFVVELPAQPAPPVE